MPSGHSSRLLRASLCRFCGWDACRVRPEYASAYKVVLHIAAERGSARRVNRAAAVSIFLLSEPLSAVDNGDRCCARDRRSKPENFLPGKTRNRSGSAAGAPDSACCRCVVHLDLQYPPRAALWSDRASVLNLSPCHSYERGPGRTCLNAVTLGCWACRGTPSQLFSLTYWLASLARSRKSQRLSCWTLAGCKPPLPSFWSFSLAPR